MSTNEFGPDHEKSVTDAEGVMFASQPVWDRNRKRRGFGGGRRTAPPPPETTVAPEPRSYAARDDMILDRPVGATAAGVTAGTLASDEPLAAPIGRSTTRTDRSPRSNGTAPAMIATGAVALVAIAAGGWYMSRPHEGVPTLTPGSTTSQVAAAPLPPVDTPPTARAQMANQAASAPPSAHAPAPVRVARAAPIGSSSPAHARARPAASSASATGVNASATAALPDSPQPYAKVNPTAPAPVNPAPAPTQVAPPSTTAPAEPPAAIPQTPPTQQAQPATPPADTTPPDATPPSQN